MRTVLARLAPAFTAWPAPRGWLESAGLLALFAMTAIPIGWAAGLLTPRLIDASPAQIARTVVIALFVPSLFEETLYRALMLPPTSERRSRAFTIGSLLVSTALFVAGHPLAALFAPTARPLFFDATFLALAGLFGLAAGIAYLRTNSIWPSVAMHWLVVVAWAAFFGGWIMLGA